MNKRFTLSIIFAFFTFLILQAQVITMTTYSQTDQWSPFRITKSGAVLTWTASNSIIGTIIKNENQPIFDFSGNDGSDIFITISSPDGFDGLTIFDLRDRFNGVSVNGIPSQMLVKEIDISAATNLIELSTQYNRLPSLDITTLTKLQKLNVRGSRQLANGLDISKNTLLTQIIADVTALEQIDISNNSLLTDLRLYDAYFTSNVLDQLLVDLDNHNLFNGSLRITEQKANETITSASYSAYQNLIIKGWTIDVPSPPNPGGPDINITGLGNSIPGNGSNVPSISDNTDFGSVASGETIVKTFTIENLGDANLDLTGTPLVAISGTNAADFSISTDPVSPVAPAGSTAFNVTYTAGSIGVRSAILTITSNDLDEPSYTFNIQAEATASVGPVIAVSGNGSIISSGNTPSIVNGTDFGVTNIGTTLTQTITIENAGNVSFSLFGSAITVGNGIYNTIPTVITGIVLNPGDTYDFQVTFSPITAGVFNGQIQLFSNALTNPYILNFTGQGIDPADIQDIMISQYYDGFNSGNKWIEVKNISNRTITEGEYYLALYNQSQSLTGAPSASQVIPAMNVGDVVLFRNTSAVIPASGNLGQPGIPSPVCTFDNGDDMIIVSSSNDVNSYINRVDMIGRQVTWGRNTSYIKGGCATEIAHRDFDESYWIRVAVEEVNNADPLSNLALGTQAVGPTSFDGSNWSNGPGGRTRNVIISTNINPVSIVACDLTIAPGLTWNYDGGTTATLDVYRDLITAGANLIVGDTESLRTRGETANLGTFTKIEKSNTLFNLHDNTYWSSPITAAAIEGVFPGVNPARIFEYKAGDPNPVYQNQPGYENYIYWWNKPNGSMDVGYGYAVEGPSAPVDASDNYIVPFQHQISFTGIPNNGTQIIDVFYKGSEDVNLENGNFNLLGNPYPTAINIEAFLGTNQNVYQIALWTHATEVSEGDGGEFTDADYVFYNQGGANSPDVTTNIGSSQGFMVRTTGSGGQVNFTNGMKLSNANNQFFKSDVQKKSQGLVKEGSKDRIWLRLHDGKVKSDILVGFFEESTDGLDNFFDAVDLPNNKNLNLYSKIDEEKYVIQGMGIFSPEKSVPLGFNLKEAKELNLSISGLEGVFRDIDVYLVDHALNKTHNLKEGAYKFNETEIGDFPNRFTLQFSKNALAVDEILTSSDFVLSNSGNGFRINASKTVKEVKVYDVLGRNIEVIRPNLQSFYIDLPQAKTGAVLIFEVKLENGSVLNKKAIKL